LAKKPQLNKDPTVINGESKSASPSLCPDELKDSAAGMRRKGGQYISFSIIMIVAAILIFANLANRCLWQDEAETAVVSKTISTFGIPMGYDGKNFFSQEGEHAYGKDHIWAIFPWFPHYLLALFFWIFGISTFAARLPFALFGLATVGLTYFFTKTLTRNQRTAALATALLVLSVPFLLLCRQCRYYPLVAFFSLLGLYGYLLILENKRAGAVLFTVSAILVFYCQNLFSATLLAAVIGHALLFHRRYFGKVLTLSLIVVVAGLPWLFSFPDIGYVKQYGYRFFNRHFFGFFLYQLFFIHLYIFPAYLLLIPLGYGGYLWARHKRLRAVLPENLTLWKNLSLLLLFIICTLVGLAIFAGALFFRHFAQLIPPFCIILAASFEAPFRSRFKAALAAAAVMLGLFFYADYSYRTTRPDKRLIRNWRIFPYINFIDYLYEITHDYDGPIEGIVKYLNKHGTDDDIVVITYGDLPLKFYTRMRVLGGLTGEDLSPAVDADWVIIRRDVSSRQVARVKSFIMENIALERYDLIVIDYPDITWENNADPFWHQFRTVEDYDNVVILRKKR